MRKLLCNVVMMMCIFSGMNVKESMAQCWQCGPGSFSGAATGIGSYAVGWDANAIGDTTIAIGYKNAASAGRSIVLGNVVQATAVGSMTIGSGVFNTSTLLSNGIANSLMIGMNSNVPTMFVESSSGAGTWGNVGIGTTAPIGLLHLREEAGASNELVLEKYDNTLARLRFQQGTSFLGHLTMDDAEDMHLTNRTNNRNITFNINQGLTQTEAMRIVGSSANVGIGTTDPQGRLHVRNSSSGSPTDMVIDRNGTAQANLRFNTGGSTQLARIGANSTGNHLYYDMLQASADHVFRVNTSTEVMRVTGVTERVGIGTNGPTTRLHVQGPATQNGILRVTVAGTSADQFLLIGNTNSTPASHFEPYIVGRTDHADDSGLWLWAETPDEAGPPAMVFRAAVAVTSGQLTQRPLFTWTNGGSTRMRMDAAGNLGIGTTTPAYKLAVNGDAAKTGGGVWQNISDMNLKQDIEEFTDGLDVLLQFQPKTYKYNGTYQLSPERTYVGVVAQDVAEVAPYMVNTVTLTDTATGDSNDFLSYDGTALTYIIVNAFKELEQRVSAHDQLAEQVEQLNQQVTLLQQSLAECCNSPAHRLNGEDSDLSPAVPLRSFGEYVILNTDPNPFSDHTRISFSVPEGTAKAEILVTDPTGGLVNRFELRERGTGEVTLYGSSISSGMYVCSLVLDGRIAVSRRLIKN
jgi:hypothetical protein